MSFVALGYTVWGMGLAMALHLGLIVEEVMFYDERRGLVWVVQNWMGKINNP